MSLVVRLAKSLRCISAYQRRISVAARRKIQTAGKNWGGNGRILMVRRRRTARLTGFERSASAGGCKPVDFTGADCALTVRGAVMNRGGRSSGDRAPSKRSRGLRATRRPADRGGGCHGRRTRPPQFIGGLRESHACDLPGARVVGQLGPPALAASSRPTFAGKNSSVSTPPRHVGHRKRLGSGLAHRRDRARFARELTAGNSSLLPASQRAGRGKRSRERWPSSRGHGWSASSRATCWQ